MKGKYYAITILAMLVSGSALSATNQPANASGKASGDTIQDIGGNLKMAPPPAKIIQKQTQKGPQVPSTGKPVDSTGMTQSGGSNGMSHPQSGQNMPGPPPVEQTSPQEMQNPQGPSQGGAPDMQNMQGAPQGMPGPQDMQGAPQGMPGPQDMQGAPPGMPGPQDMQEAPSNGLPVPPDMPQSGNQ